MIIVGLTGGFCTGKTKTAGMFRERGVKVISADRIGHNIIKKRSLVWEKIIGCFGRDILKKSGEIDRGRLAEIVFSNKNKLKKLNKITHPVIKKEIKKIIGKEKDKIRILAVEAPLLFEAGIKDWFDKIIVVSCNKKVQYRRAVKKYKISKKELELRMRNQWPLKRKEKLADFVIDNNGTIGRTKKQVFAIWRELQKGGER